MKLAIFVNGYATSGKDETVKAMTSILETQQFYVTAVSSIDPIRNMLRTAGYNVDNKTPEMRAFLAEVGDAAEKFDQTKTKHVVDTVHFYLNKHGQGAVFIHVREALMIKTIEARLNRDIRVVKIKVNRPGIRAIQSNQADMDVNRTQYNFTIYNSGSLHQLKDRCLEAINYLQLRGRSEVSLP